MVCAEKPGLLVLVADRAEVAADNLEVGVLADVVLGHLEHAQVQVGDRAEGAACDKDHRLLVCIPKDGREPVGGERVVGRV